MTDTAATNYKSYLEEGTTKAKSGIAAWIFSTDHKRIGLLYLSSIAIFFTVAVIIGILMRLELMLPGRTIMDAQYYMESLHKILKY